MRRYDDALIHDAQPWALHWPTDYVLLPQECQRIFDGPLLVGRTALAELVAMPNYVRDGCENESLRIVRGQLIQIADHFAQHAPVMSLERTDLILFQHNGWSEPAPEFICTWFCAAVLARTR